VVTKVTDRVWLAQADYGLEAANAEKLAVGQKQNAWLERGRESRDSKAKEWKAKKLHRVSARRWMLLLDNAVHLFVSQSLVLLYILMLYSIIYS